MFSQGLISISTSGSWVDLQDLSDGLCFGETELELPLEYPVWCHREVPSLACLPALPPTLRGRSISCQGHRCWHARRQAASVWGPRHPRLPTGPAMCSAHHHCLLEYPSPEQRVMGGWGGLSTHTPQTTQTNTLICFLEA